MVTMCIVCCVLFRWCPVRDSGEWEALLIGGSTSKGPTTAGTVGGSTIIGTNIGGLKDYRYWNWDYCYWNGDWYWNGD